MEADSFLLEIGSNTENFNIAKEAVIERLFSDGILTEEQAKTYIEKWQIIIFRKSWFKRWLNKFSKGEENNYSLKFVKFED